MTNLIAAIVILAIVALAAVYVYRAKRAGKKCIGCPDSGRCSGSCGQCSCGRDGD